MRIDKLIEKNLNTSRKQMKRLFLTGQVIVDGEKIYEEKLNVDSQIHEITVSGKRLETTEQYWLLHKPQGYVTANSDQNHQTVFDLLTPSDQHPDLYAVGRLDRDTTGLLLLTTNGPLGFALLHPDRHVEKTYHVTVNEALTTQDEQAFLAGIEFIGGIVCKPAKLKILETSPTKSTALLTIAEGKFHQVKKMFLAQRKKVIALKRVSMGPLSLEQEEVGSYRALTSQELHALKPYFN